MGRVSDRAREFRETAGGDLTPERVRRIEWCLYLEGMLSQAMDDAKLSCLDALSAAAVRLREIDPNRPPMRRLGMEACTTLMEQWEWETAVEGLREELERSGAAALSEEEELIRAAETAKRAYRRERRGEPS